MTPIRVLRIIDRLNVGGPALQASVLAERLDPTRFEQVLLAGAIDPDEGDYVTLRAPGLRVEQRARPRPSAEPADDAHALGQISAAIRRFRPHVVHTHKAKAGALGRPAAWTHRVPATVHTFHGHLLHGYFSPVKTRAVVAVERWPGPRRPPRSSPSAVGCATSSSTAGIGRPRPVRGRRRRESTSGPSPTRCARAEPSGSPAASGRDVRRPARAVKRPDRFVDVAIEVARSHPDVCFAIAGDGELADEVRARYHPSAAAWCSSDGAATSRRCTAPATWSCSHRTTRGCRCR